VGLHPFFVPPKGEAAQAFLGALAPGRRALRVGRRSLKTLIVDSTLLWVLQPSQLGQGSGLERASWVRWGSFSVYGVKLHLICSTNRVPIS